MPVFKDVAAMLANLPQTSIALSASPPEEVCVRFRRWTQCKGTAYQAGDIAGFLIPDAREFVRQGMADVIDPTTGAVIQVLPAEHADSGGIVDHWWSPVPTHWDVPPTEEEGPGWRRFFTRASDRP